LNVVIAHVTNEYTESSEGNEQREDDKEETVFGEIGEGGNEHGEDKGGGPWWDGEELSSDCAVAEGPDDGGGEVGIGVGRDDESEIHESTSDDTEVLEDGADVLEGGPDGETRVTDVLLQTSLDESLLILRQPFDGLGEVSNEPPHDKCNDAGKGTLEDENPSPSRVVGNAVHLADAGGEQTTESTSQRSGGKEEGVSLLDLITFVPHGNEVRTSREDGSLEDAQEEASSEKTAQAMNKSLHDSDETETEHHKRQPDGRAELLQEEVGWDFEQDIRNEEDGEGGVVFIIDEVQLFLETEDGCIGDVYSIQEGEEVE